MQRKLLSILMALSVVSAMMSTVAMATDFTDMPDDYSTAALQAAVENGLLSGNNGEIMANDILTRAQMGTILVRAFGAETAGDISGFTDMDAQDWHYDDMSRAVQMGIMEGYGDIMCPDAPITRQEAFVVLARAFALDGGDVSVLDAYQDGVVVSDWAKVDVAAMVSTGMVLGDGLYLNPMSNILRKDFAVIMDRMVKTYLTESGTYTQLPAGTVMVNQADVTLENTVISGDLIIGDGVGEGDVTLYNVTVEGDTIVRGCGTESFVVSGDSYLGTVKMQKVEGNVRIAVEDTAKVDLIAVNDGQEEVIVEGKVNTVEIAQETPVRLNEADIEQVVVTASYTEVMVQGDTVVDSMVTEESAINGFILVDENAVVETAIVYGEGTTIAGAGSVESVEVKGDYVAIDTVGTSLVIDAYVVGTVAGDAEFAGGTSGITGEEVAGQEESDEEDHYSSGGSSSGTTTVTTTAVTGVAAADLDNRATTENEDDASLATNYVVMASQTSDCNYVDVSIHADEVKLHENGQGDYGYWVGMTIDAPEGATALAYHLGEETQPEDTATMTTATLEQDAISIYSDGAEHTTRWVRIQWLNGAEVISTTDYNMVIDIDAMVVADEAALQAAMATGGNIVIAGTIGSAQMYTSYDMTVANTAVSGGTVYGALNLLAENITIDGVCVNGRGGGSDTLKNAINIVAANATVTNCTINTQGGQGDVVCNAIVIYPTASDVNYTIAGNTIGGVSNTDPNWDGAGIAITEGYDLTARFSMSQTSVVCDMTTAQLLAMAQANVFGADSTNELVQIDWTAGGADYGDYKFGYFIDSMSTNAASGAQIYLNGDVSLASTLDLATDATLNIVSGAIFTIEGTLNNNGTIIIHEGATAIDNGTITGTGTIVGEMVVGDTTGDVVGDTTGDVVGDTAGDVVGDTTGDVVGDTAGDVVGDTTGDVVGDTTGDVVGDTTGDVVGDTTGDVVGDTTGDVVGDTAGDVVQDTQG